MLQTTAKALVDSNRKSTRNFSECNNVATAIIINSCDRNCSNLCETSFDCNKQKMKQNQQLKPLPQFLQLYKFLKASARTAKNVESTFSPRYDLRYRRNKNGKTLAKSAKTAPPILQVNNIDTSQHQCSVTLPATKSIPLMTAITTNSNSKVATKKSATIKKGKSLSSASTSFAIRSLRFRPLSGLKLTSLFSLLTIVCLETILLSTVSNCAKTFYMHWNTSNSIFRIDNTDHIIDINKGNLAFEFDQVHIICPVYEPGTYENETEKYIIYNVSKVEYETCRITNADPRVIAICDKPQKLMFFTITFRPFTPQPGGLEFIPGNDYYFISTSSKDDLYRRIGGRCSTNNMKVVFKVCCVPEEKNITNAGGRAAGGVINGIAAGGNSNTGIVDTTNHIGGNGSSDMNVATGSNNINQQHINSINRGIIPVLGGININNGVSGVNGGVQYKPSSIGGANIDQFNRIPMHGNGINSGIGNGISGIGLGSHGGNGMVLTPGGGHSVSMMPGAGGGIGINGQYPGHQQTGIRINNVPSQQHPPHINNKHPNEVVKNEELTYNSAADSLYHKCRWGNSPLHLFKMLISDTTLSSITAAFTSIYNNNAELQNNKFAISKLLFKLRTHFSLNLNPILILSVLLVVFSKNVFKLQVRTKSEKLFCSSTKTTCKVSLRKSKKSSYLPIFSSNYSPS